MAATVNLTFVGTAAAPAAGVVNLAFGADASSPGDLLCGPGAECRWAPCSDTRSSQAVAPWGAAALAPGGNAALPWGRCSDTLGTAAALPWAHNSSGLAGSAQLPWGPLGTGLGVDVLSPWDRALVTDALTVVPWARSANYTQWAQLPWEAAAGADRSAELPWGPSGQAIVTAALPWGPGSLVIGINDPLPPRVVPVPPSGVPGWVNLRFCRARGDSLTLRLGVNPCGGLPGTNTTLISARSSYVQVHTVSAVRLPDLAPVWLDRFDLSADESAIGWTLSATGPTALLAMLSPVAGLPARLRVTLDGQVWEFVVEGLRDTWQFGKRDVTITARSASALLADPYAPEGNYLNDVPMTAQQLLQDALQYTGVGLDWRCTDWLVPEGAWSHAGTPMSAVRRVADAIGAIVQSPRAGENVIVMPRYSTLPWEWAAATPDVILESLDPVAVHGFERADRPGYEGVYISGQAQGVLALVKRTGTGPGLYMPMVTDGLMTHLDACMQRGSALLGRAGAQAKMTLTLPVLTGPGEPGVIDPGKLVSVMDPAGAWRGMVRSTSVAVNMPVIEQTLTLERHL